MRLTHCCHVGWLRWLELRQAAARIGRPLKCPACSFKFAFRHHLWRGGQCPRCKLPLGFPAYYRAILFIASEGVSFGTIALGYIEQGTGWLLLGWPFGLAAAFIAQSIILRVFPPKLEPHAEGNIWLKLT
jgi:hypothetical protein